MRSAAQVRAMIQQTLGRLMAAMLPQLQPRPLL